MAASKTETTIPTTNSAQPRLENSPVIPCTHGKSKRSLPRFPIIPKNSDNSSVIFVNNQSKIPSKTSDNTKLKRNMIVLYPYQEYLFVSIIDSLHSLLIILDSVYTHRVLKNHFALMHLPDQIVSLILPAYFSVP